jgi:hypothetical protein
VKGWAAFAWDFWRTLSGLAAIAILLAGALMWFLSDDGPVVEVKRGPVPGVIYARSEGTLSYTLKTLRHQSCPGVVGWQFIRRGPVEGDFDAHSIINSAPINPKDMVVGEVRDALIERQLSKSIYPGRWLYRHTITSRCPTGFERVEVMAEFEVEVVPTQEPERKP